MYCFWENWPGFSWSRKVSCEFLKPFKATWSWRDATVKTLLQLSKKRFSVLFPSFSKTKKSKNLQFLLKNSSLKLFTLWHEFLSREPSIKTKKGFQANKFNKEKPVRSSSPSENIFRKKEDVTFNNKRKTKQIKIKLIKKNSSIFTEPKERSQYETKKS